MTRRNILQYRWRRIIVVCLVVAGAVWLVIKSPDSYQPVFENPQVSAEGNVNAGGDNDSTPESTEGILASVVLEKIAVKGRAPKTGYERSEKFYETWPSVDGCNLRQRIIKREFGESAKFADDKCTVLSGEFTEPYTGQYLIFREKAEISKGIQIDHVVALSDAWQKGAQQLSQDERYNLATDPLNLLAVDASANQKKSDGDAATWLPSNKSFRCQYVARQVSVKYKYKLWVTQAERDAIDRVLQTCPKQLAVGVEL